MLRLLPYLIIGIAAVMLVWNAWGMLVVFALSGGELEQPTFTLLTLGALSALASIIVFVAPIWARTTRTLIASPFAVASGLLMAFNLGLFESTPAVVLAPPRGFLAPAPRPDETPRPLPDNVQFFATWGTRGVGEGQFDHPDGITVDAFGDIYVADTGNHRVQVFTRDGKFLRKWGTQGDGNGEFEHPAGIAVGPSGNVYVTDAGNHRVQVFTRDGKFLTKWGTQGDGDGRFQVPDGIALDTADNIYVAEAGSVFEADLRNDRVQVFNPIGEFLAKWGSSGFGDGQFQRPHHIAIGESGNVHVADSFNHRVQVFSRSGEFLAQWCLSQPCLPDEIPHGIAVDASGNIYVTEAVNRNRIHVFSHSGEPLTTWGSTGTADGQFAGPQGIAVDGLGNVYVTDLLNDRVQVFRVTVP